MGIAGKNIDFTEGKLSPKIISFVIPLILTSTLQTLYHIADKMVVGMLSGDTLALAAVGSATSICNLVINLLVSFSAGCSVVTANARGARDSERISRSVHTSMTFAAIASVVVMLIGLLITRPALTLLGTKPELFSRASTYVYIIFLGVPAATVYNFGASAMRALGDTKTSLRILSVSGIINVVLNVIFVAFLGMSVAGVALATIISQYVSAVRVVVIMMRGKGEAYHLQREKLGIDFALLREMIRFGVPTMIQSSMFTISNVLLSGAVNTLTTEEISAKTIAFSMTELISTAMAAYTHAAVTSTAQNCGARKTDRIKSSLVCCIWQSALIGISMAAVILLLREPLTMLFIDRNDPNMDIVVQYTMEALWTITPTYFLLGTMNSLAGTMRGAGYALVPMIISIVGVCGLRIVWIYTAFRTEALHSLSGLFVAYPITYVITILSFVIAFVIMMKKIGLREPASVK